MADVQREKAGAIWVRKSSKDGSTFLSGVLELNGEKVNVIGFKNRNKQPGDKFPDYQLFVSEDRKPSAPAKKPAPRSASSEDGEVEL